MLKEKKVALSICSDFGLQTLVPKLYMVGSRLVRMIWVIWRRYEASGRCKIQVSVEK